ncbi:hypothetical protein KKE06_03210 [Candidatus Micrarchaeota archaeon]|nr:hypothetical protein [Candidatus Micrarchaeota archaeon]MBU1930398.1 hypothetical protein [Candidatus Micrarchaeota archaeon]
MSGQKNIVWFEEIAKHHIPLVGGKGANLGEMFANFPIPNGFSITVHAFSAFLKQNHLHDKIKDLLDKTDENNTTQLDAASKQIEEWILAGKIPAELEKEIIVHHKKLGADFVAVRSSATAEDLPDASFAGQQATFLNVKSEKLVEAVKACWASLYSARAIFYRVTKGFAHELVLISVVVQEMVNSKKAGVLFTANPITNSREEMIIEAAFGLGETIVSGMVTPDTLILRKNDLSVVSHNIGGKRLALVRDEHGENKEIEIGEEEANSAALTEKEWKELAKLGLQIEKHYNQFMDIEWAIDDKIYILQARPITTLK